MLLNEFKKKINEIKSRKNTKIKKKKSTKNTNTKQKKTLRFYNQFTNFKMLSWLQENCIYNRVCVLFMMVLNRIILSYLFTANGLTVLMISVL